MKYLVRQSNLNQRNNQNFNIISGEHRNPVKVPLELENPQNDKNAPSWLWGETVSCDLVVCDIHNVVMCSLLCTFWVIY